MKLLKLDIRNFRGFAQASKDFDGEREIIEAQNKEGKSIFREAFRWACGFDVSGFEPVIQPTNIKIGTPDKPITTEVVATVEKDNLIYTLKRKSEQKWRINKDTQAVEFVGNVGKFFFDSESEVGANIYKDKVASLFGCNYADLEIVIDIAYFNNDTAKWKWDSRRKWLFDKLDIDNIVKGLADNYDLLANDLKKGKDEVDIQKSLTAEKSAIKKAQEDNLVLIEDKIKQLATYTAIDFNSMKNKLAELQKEYEKLLMSANKTNKNTIIAEMQSNLNDLQRQLRAEQDNIYKKERDLSDRKRDLDFNNVRIQSEIKKCQNDILTYKHEVERIESEIKGLEIKKFDEHAKVCKECGQLLQSDKIEMLIANFETAKTNSINDLRFRAENGGRAIQNATDKANNLSEQLKALQTQIKALDSETVDKSKAVSLESEINKLTMEISTLKMAEVKDTVAEKVETVKSEMAAINRELGKEVICADIQQSIETLREQSFKLTAQEANRLRKQLQLKEYVQSKIALVSDKVNSYFGGGVTFRFFKENGANAENEFENTCECLVNGLSYRDCTSTGTKTVANIHTTIGLQKILGVSVPLWVDELAVVTSDIDCEGYQFIGLQAMRGKKLDGVLRIDKMYSADDCVIKERG